ncbi:hypothetical protein DXA21_22405, partial [Parabacteroides distasonis]
YSRNIEKAKEFGEKYGSTLFFDDLDKLAKAKEFGEKYGSTLFFDDLDKLAKCDSIDAVYIASPTSFHFEQAVYIASPTSFHFEQALKILKIRNMYLLKSLLKY